MGLLIYGASITASAQVVVYVPNNATNTLGKLTVNASTGALTPLPPQVTSNFPDVVVASPDNHFIFVGDLGGTVDVFVASAGGGTTAVGAPFVSAGSVTGLAIDPTGKFLYSSNLAANQILTFSVDQTTGRLTPVGLPLALPSGSLPRGMAVDGAGHLYVAFAGTGSIAQYTMDAATGALTGGATVASGVGTQQLAVSPAGNYLFASNFNGGTVSGFTIATGTGALTANGSVSIGGNPQGLAVNHTGTALFVVDNTGDRVVVYSINASGVLTLSSSADTGDLPVGAAVDPGGSFLYVSNSGSGSVSQYTISAGAGLSTRTDFSSGGSSPLFLLAAGAPSIPITSVPAASTWSLVFLGVLLAASSLLLYKRVYR